MHSRKELAEMERREMEEKARQEVDEVKRRFFFEKEEKRKKKRRNRGERRIGRGNRKLRRKKIKYQGHPDVWLSIVWFAGIVYCHLHQWVLCVIINYLSIIYHTYPLLLKTQTRVLALKIFVKCISNRKLQ